MTIENKAVEAVVAGEVEIPSDIYVGRNTERQHIAEFFYRAHANKLLDSGETVVAIFDCIILERDGRRLGGLTLHDYAVLTDRNLITWGRGLNKDIVDRFPWTDVTLDKFGRRNPLEGVIKITYLLKPVGNKRKIALRSQGTPVPEVAPVKPRGTAIYLDLMPSGEVQVCAEMIQYFVHSNGDTPGVEGFRERFRDDLADSHERMTSVDFWMRPFYIDMGNGILVEAGSVAEQRALSAPASTTRQNTASPRPAPAPASRPARPAPAEVAPVAPASPAPTPEPAAGAVQPAQRPGQRITAPETVATGTNYTMTGDVPLPGGTSALNSGNRPTDTFRGTGRAGDTMRSKSSGGSGNSSALRETVRLDTSPLNIPSKLEAYEGRATGRTVINTTQSRLTRQTSQPRPATPPAASEDAAARTPAARYTPPPRPARPAPAVARQTGNGEPSPLPPATYVSPPELPLPKRPDRTDRVLGAMADVEAQALGRPLVVPVALALPRGLLNAYSVSRLARGLWIDPRNLGRNVSDLSNTFGAVGDVVELVTSDAERRETALRRLKIQVNTTLGDNIVFHYTVWPFVKPVLDALNLSGATARLVGPARRRVSIRQLEDEMMQMEETSPATSSMDDLGPMAGQDRSANRAASVPIVEVATTVPAAPPPSPSTPADAPLNTSGKPSADPTAGQSLDKPATKPDGSGKLDKLS